MKVLRQRAEGRPRAAGASCGRRECRASSSTPRWCRSTTSGSTRTEPLLHDEARAGRDPRRRARRPRERRPERGAALHAAAGCSPSSARSAWRSTSSTPRGVVHRDLKPHNVMLGEFGEIYLLDWGLAKILDRVELSDAAGASTTGQGSVLGTPATCRPSSSAARCSASAPAPTCTRWARSSSRSSPSRLSTRGARCSRSSSRSSPSTARTPASAPPRAASIRPSTPSWPARRRLDPADRYPTAGALSEDVERYLDEGAL